MVPGYVFILPISLAVKMSVCKFIVIYQIHPAAFAFWASTQLDNIVLNAANMKTDQSLAHLQTGTSAVAHAILEME